MATQFAVDLVFKSKGDRKIRDLSNQLQGVETKSKGAQRGLDAAGGAANRAGASFGRLGTFATNATKKLRGLQGVLLSIGAGAALGKTFSAASGLESAQTRINTLVKNYSQLDGIQEVAAASAKKFRLSQEESLTALTDLGNRLGAQGTSLKEIENIYEGFNTLLANNKVEAAQAASATLQLNQALGSGRLAGEEFNAINEATPQLLDEVARVMGVTRGELKQLAADGEISSQVLIQALTNIREKGAADLEAAFGGAFGASREFSAALKDFSAAIGTELLPAITPLLRGVTELMKLFGQLPGPVKTLTAAVVGLAGGFVLLAPAISAVVGLLSGLTVGGLIAAAPWVALAAGIGAVAYAFIDAHQAQVAFDGALRGNSISAVEVEISKLEVKIRELEAASLAAAESETRFGGAMGYAGVEAAALRGQLEELIAKKKELALYESVGVRPDSKYYGPGFEAPKPPPKRTPTPVPTGRGSGRGSGGAAARESQVPQLTNELQLKQRLFQLDQAIFAAQLKGNTATEEALKMEKVLEEKASALRDIQLEKIPPNEKELKTKLAILEADQKLAELSQTRQQKEADRIKSFEDYVRDLQWEIDLAGAMTQEEVRRLETERELQRLKKDGIATSEAELDLVRKMNGELDQTKAKAAEIKSQQAQLQGLYDGIGSTIADGIGSAIDAVASGTEDLGETLKKLGKQILAQVGKMLIFYALAQAFGALAGPSGGGIFGALARGFGFRANGGPVEAGGKYIVGEKGPEILDMSPDGSGGYVYSNAASKSAMSRWNAGNSAGGAAGAAGGADAEGGAGYSPVINISTGNTLTFEGKNYVSRDDFQMGLAQAAKAGAKQGEAATLRRLQMSSATRRRVGV